jgi:cytoskeletal protein RodZ
MKKKRFGKESLNPEKSKKGFSNLTSLVVLGVVIVALAGLGILVFSKSSNTVTAQTKNESPEKKKYIATKNIVVDKDTGQVRKPTDSELKELVDSLAVLTKRSDENLTSSAVANGGVSMDLDGGYAGTMLARPNPDGTMETRCVFTFQEAADFLGLVEDDK